MYYNLPMAEDKLSELDISKVHTGTIPIETPMMFVDGSEVYKKFTEEHIVHKRGFFIMAPSGAGKSYFINKQTEKHWMDADTLWELTNAHPAGFWWTQGLDILDEVDQRSDVITIQAKKLGLWLIGASNAFMKPDAIVLPSWRTHVKYIKAREKEAYDGGATSDNLQGVLNHRKWIKKWSKQGVPEFKSVQEAADYLASVYEKENA
jgi:hypothetical protein